MSPRLPAALWSQLGPITVLKSKTLLEDREAFGESMWRPREITIDTSGHIATQLATLWHEAVEVALWDSGLHNTIPHDMKEAVCDALGSYLAGMMLAGCLTVRSPK